MENSRFCYRCGSPGPTQAYKPDGAKLSRWLCARCCAFHRRRDANARQLNLFHAADLKR